VSITPEIWSRILECGALAPSGDNLQPWLVTQRGDTLHVSIDQSRDRSLYNVGYRASLIALGAMIENMVIAGGESGFDVKVALSPDSPGALPSASLGFQRAAVPADALFPCIARRSTNRKPYAKGFIPRPTLDSLRAAIPTGRSAELRIVEDARQKRIVARAASLNDRLLFTVRPLHDTFFETIRWTEEDAKTSRDGLFIKTLELGPVGPGFKAMRSWAVVRAGNALGASLTAPLHSYRTFLRSAAFGFLQMGDASHDSYVEGGRFLERIWLTATLLGLSFQPMAGMLYLLPYLSSQGEHPFGKRQLALLEKADALFRQVLPLDSHKAAIMLFRVGYSAPPSARSLRRPLHKYSVRPPWSQ